MRFNQFNMQNWYKGAQLCTMVKGMKSFLNNMKFYRILSQRFRFYKPILMVWLRMDWREHKVIIYLER